MDGTGQLVVTFHQFLYCFVLFLKFLSERFQFQFAEPGQVVSFGLLLPKAEEKKKREQNKQRNILRFLVRRCNHLGYCEKNQDRDAKGNNNADIWFFVKIFDAFFKSIPITYAV